VNINEARDFNLLWRKYRAIKCYFRDDPKFHPPSRRKHKQQQKSSLDNDLREKRKKSQEASKMNELQT
jgi:FtsZ-interacting cell division protein ZipA